MPLRLQKVRTQSILNKCSWFNYKTYDRMVIRYCSEPTTLECSLGQATSLNMWCYYGVTECCSFISVLSLMSGSVAGDLVFMFLFVVCAVLL